MLNPDQQSARIASQVADRINELFPSGAPGMPGLAKAQNTQAVLLQVPPQYKLNMPRYLRVVRLVPMGNRATAHDTPKNWLTIWLTPPEPYSPPFVWKPWDKRVLLS